MPDPHFITERWLWVSYWLIHKAPESEFLAPDDLLKYIKYERLKKWFDEMLKTDNFGWLKKIRD